MKVTDCHYERSGYTIGQLSRHADLPKRTVANWLAGEVRRPRHASVLLKLAAALHLDAGETNEMLQAAGQPSLAELWAADEDGAFRNLLAPWVASIRRQRQTAPFQAIPDVPFFLGREKVLAALGEALLGGFGKTALAAHLAYRLRPHLPDGVLWVRVDRAEPMATLQSFAEAYGQDVSQYADLESRSRVVRNMLADKEVLIVLDNVESSEQVRPLLPPTTGSCAVLITTRRQDLEVTSGAHRFQIGTFDTQGDEAIRLFARLLGEERVGREEKLFRQIADRLGHLPLAIAIAASRMAYEPGWSASTFLEQLEQEQSRLAALTYDSLSVRLSAGLSYRQLTPEQRRFFEALGAFGSENLSIEAAAFGAGVPEEEAERHLRLLYSLSGPEAKRRALSPGSAPPRLRQRTVGSGS